MRARAIDIAKEKGGKVLLDLFCLLKYDAGACYWQIAGIMEFFEKNKVPLLWLLNGFGAGLTLIGISHAGIPSRTTPSAAQQAGSGKTILREIKGGKITSPEFEADLAELNRLETRYVESSEQLERLKGRRARVAIPSQKSMKKGVRK